jgi:hypothetical protein
MALTTGLATGWASVIQSTVVLPPASGAYALEGVCLSALNRCTGNAMVSGFNTITDTEQNGNELVVVDAVYSADVFTDSNGLPGTFVGQLSLSGTADFTYVGRDPSVNPLGIFTTALTGFEFTGMLNGNSFEVTQNPASVSIGSTTILEATLVPPIEYSVGSSLDIFGQYSFNGSPFMTAPEQMTTLTAVPEPGSGALAGSILVGFLRIAWRRHRIR